LIHSCIQIVFVSEFIFRTVVWLGGKTFPSGIVKDSTADATVEGADEHGKFGHAFAAGRFQFGSAGSGVQFAVSAPRAAATGTLLEMAGKVVVYAL
jgi:hypothetical protein